MIDKRIEPRRFEFTNDEMLIKGNLRNKTIHGRFQTTENGTKLEQPMDGNWYCLLSIEKIATQISNW